MKKALSVLLTIVLLFSIMATGAFAASTAIPASASVLVNGKTVSFEAYNIDGSNYFKLRDLAKVLSGTEKQIEVGWDAGKNAISLTSGNAYSPVGGELTSSGNKENQPAVLSTAAVYLDGSKANLTAYNIGGFNYFKLRDVGSAINFGVGWDGASSTITIDTSIGYAAVNLSVHFLDVGQGDSIFIVLPNGKTMLIDASEGKYGDTVVNYIKCLGYNTVDYLIATHPHADHIGGMTKVVKSLNIGAVYMPNAVSTTQTYADLLMAIQSAGLKITTAKAGVSILTSNGVTACFVAPNKDSYEDINNFSAVLKLTYNSNSFLFMGDAEALSENEISADINVDVLKVGHHVSTSSSGEAFLQKVSPKYAVISVGADNDYGHPAQITLDKLSRAGAIIYRTDKDGTVVFKSDGTNITVNKTASYPTGGSSNSGSSNVVISSVDKSAELVTIKNNSTNDVNLTGWVLVSVTGNQRYTFPTFTLKAGGKVTVASGGASGDFVWTTSNIWNNSGSDPATLNDSQGNLMFTYSD